MEIEVDCSPAEENIRAIYNGLVEFNEPYFPGHHEEKLALYLRNAGGDMVGGLYAVIHYTSVRLQYIWLSPEMRGNRYGSKLLEKLEQTVGKKGVTGIYLDTYSFQAPGFYEKLGFHEAGRYKDYPKVGIDKIFYQKRLQR